MQVIRPSRRSAEPDIWMTFGAPSHLQIEISEHSIIDQSVKTSLQAILFTE